LRLRPPPTSPLFPYTTLFRSRVLAALPPEAIGRTIRVVLFCGEEVGLFGSWAYTADHAGEAERTRFMLNLDGAGRGKGGSESLRSEEHTSELQSRFDLVCRLL